MCWLGARRELQDVGFRKSAPVRSKGVPILFCGFVNKNRKKNVPALVDVVSFRKSTSASSTGDPKKTRRRLRPMTMRMQRLTFFFQKYLFQEMAENIFSYRRCGKIKGKQTLIFPSFLFYSAARGANCFFSL